MRKKRGFFYLGLIISLAGVVILFNSLRINGFAVSETFNNFQSYLFPLILFFGGILIAGIGNTLEETILTPDVNEQDRQESRKQGKKARRLREEVLRFSKETQEFSKRNSKYSPPDYYNAVKNYSTSMEELKEILHGSFKMPEQITKGYKKYDDFKDDSVLRVLRTLKKDVLENKKAFSTNPRASEIAEMRQYLQELKEKGLIQGDVPSIEYLTEIYSKKSKTFPASALPKGTILISSLPDEKNYFRYNRFVNNPKFKDCPTAKEALECLIQESPEASACSIPEEVTGKEFVRYAGAILKGGKIRDADLWDFGSFVIDGEPSLRIRGPEMKPGNFVVPSVTKNLPYFKRIPIALKGNKEYHNEFIIKDYKVKGVYLNGNVLKEGWETLSEKEKECRRNIVSETVETVLKNQLPLYEYQVDVSPSGKKKRNFVKITNPEGYAQYFENPLSDKSKRNL